MLMLLTSHIIIALTSLILSGILIIRPLRRLLKVSYTLISLTLGTGVMLIFTGANIWHVCLSGTIYTLLVAGATELTRRRLPAINIIGE